MVYTYHILSNRFHIARSYRWPLSNIPFISRRMLALSLAGLKLYDNCIEYGVLQRKSNPCPREVCHD